MVKQINNLERARELAIGLQEKQTWIRQGLADFLSKWKEITSDISTSHKYVLVFSDNDDEATDFYYLKYGSADVFYNYDCNYEGKSAIREWSDSQYFDRSASMYLVKNFIKSIGEAFENEVVKLNELNEEYLIVKQYMENILKSVLPMK